MFAKNGLKIDMAVVEFEALLGAPGGEAANTCLQPAVPQTNTF
jgi:hypothetical protein